MDRAINPQTRIERTTFVCIFIIRRLPPVYSIIPSIMERQRKPTLGNKNHPNSVPPWRDPALDLPRRLSDDCHREYDPGKTDCPDHGLLPGRRICRHRADAPPLSGTALSVPWTNGCGQRNTQGEHFFRITPFPDIFLLLFFMKYAFLPYPLEMLCKKV